MYVRRYASTIQGALTKSSISWEMVTSDVDTMDVSRLENRRPTSRLRGASDELSQHQRCGCPLLSPLHPQVTP